MNIVGLYTVIDDFFKSIRNEKVWNIVNESFYGKRGPKPKLSLSEIITLNIVRFYIRSADLKTFHKLVIDRYSDEFPNMPNYENFLKATNKSLIAMMVFLQFVLFLGRQKCLSGIHFIDSTSLKICKNYNIYRNKVGGGSNMDQEKKEKIAVFRFGVIFPLVECNVRNYWGEKSRILREQVSKEWEIPFSDRHYISKATILGWLRRYEEGGRKIEALYPEDRGDKGRTRSIDDESLEALVRLRLENPKLSVPRLVEIAHAKGLIPPDKNVSMATFYRLMKKHKIDKAKKKEDLRKFEVQMPNDLWQSDCMHGPRVLNEDRERKTYLFAIIDDHSRLITHAQFYLAENLDNYLDCLWTAMRKRGLPRKIYVDNGPSFRAHQLQLGCASLEIALSFAKPYRPQGKGKIERFFRTVRSQFLPELPIELTLEILNKRFEEYLDMYHNRKHGTTGQEPIRRYLESASFLREAPENLPRYFRKRAVRKVNNDRTVKLDGRLYEAPLGLIGLNVTLRYENYDRIEVFLDGKPQGFLTQLYLQSNSRIHRETPLNNQKGSLFEKASGDE